MEAIRREGIGSEFWLSPGCVFWKKKAKIESYLPPGRKIFAESGRGALAAAIEALGIENEETLVPDYICSEALSQFSKTRTYKVKDNFEIDIEDIKNKISKKTKAVLIVNYFGIIQPRIKELKKLCEERELYLIEDCAQALLTKEAGSTGDVSITSFRKFLPIVDGGALVINNENLIRKTRYKNSAKKLAYTVLRCSALKLKWIRTKIPFPEYFNKRYFLLADNLLLQIPRPARISCLSRFLLQRFDYEEIAAKRRSNFLLLLDKIKTKKITPLITKLPEGACPLAFPIACKDKELLKSYLIKNRIYPATYWKSSWQILALPVDQRYGEKEMEQIVKKCKEF